VLWSTRILMVDDEQAIACFVAMRRSLHGRSRDDGGLGREGLAEMEPRASGGERRSRSW
jgi:hypothetical protein